MVRLTQALALPGGNGCCRQLWRSRATDAAPYAILSRPVWLSEPLVAAAPVYRLAADVGGTFTDVILLSADGAVTSQKILSTGPHYDRAVAEGAARLTGGVQHKDSASIAEVVHGTTVATNAVLEL